MSNKIKIPIWIEDYIIFFDNPAKDALIEIFQVYKDNKELFENDFITVDFNDESLRNIHRKILIYLTNSQISLLQRLKQEGKLI